MWIYYFWNNFYESLLDTIQNFIKTLCLQWRLILLCYLFLIALESLAFFNTSFM